MSRAVRLITGPMSVSSSQPGPSRSFSTRSTSRFCSSSYAPRWTITRDAADDVGEELVLRFEEQDGIAKLARLDANGLHVELFHILTFT